MNRTAFRLLLIGLAAVPVTAADPDFAGLEKLAAEELKQVRAPGASLAIVVGDQVVYAKGFGIANAETGAPMGADMLCRVGSTTKVLTATLALLLAEEGMLKLDAPIGTYIQGLSPKIAAVTARQLLTHTAGLRDEANMFGLHDDSALADTLRSWKDDFPFAEPGRVLSYSNPGYHLAGLLIETIGGKPYADMMAERLFEPLGMKRTTLRPLIAMTWPLAQGHGALGGVIRPFADNAATWPAGSVFTSAGEFARFTIAFLNEGRIEGRQVLPAAVVKQVSTGHVALPGSTDSKYGYGLVVSTRRGVRMLEHGGSRSGYGSFLRMVPERRFAVIAMANRSGASLPKTVERATEMFVPLEPERQREPRPRSAFEAREMPDYAGVYRNGAGSLEILAKDGKLFLKQGSREFELSKAGDDRISFQPPGAPSPQELVVIRVAGGKPEFLYGGMRAHRKSAEKRGLTSISPQ